MLPHSIYSIDDSMRYVCNTYALRIIARSPYVSDNFSSMYTHVHALFEHAYYAELKS
jgi:hypothetical protein